MRRMELPGCLATALFAVSLPAGAQVVRDGTLGMGVIGPGMDTDNMFADYKITELHGELAENSALEESNLFHSFWEFSVGTSEIASFTLSDAYAGYPIANIIAGVSGGDPSKIDGMIRTTSDLTGAALFLLNPAGIMFTDGAQLDVKGSFHASTADVLRFTDEAEFDVIDTSPPRILSSAVPSEFGFTRPDPGFISISRSRDLGVPAGETLSLIGGPGGPGEAGVLIINTAGFGDNIQAPGATVQIAAASPGTDIPIVLADLDMDNLAPGDLGNVVLQNSAEVDVSNSPIIDREAPQAGTVVIRAEQFVMADRAVIFATNWDVSDALGPIDIAVTRDIEISGGSLIRTEAKGSGASGDISLHADRLVSLTGGSGDTSSAVISVSTGPGQAGAIDIDADSIVIEGVEIGSILIVDSPQVSSQSFGLGPGGAIELNARSIELSDGARVVSEAHAEGIGGDIDVRAQNLTILNEGNDPEGTFIATNTFSTDEDAGDGGDLTIDVETIELLDGGQLIARTEGAGDAGALTVDASSLVHLSGVSAGDFPSGITSSALGNATGTGGRIGITSPIVEVHNGAQIASDTTSAGAAGSIEIIASDRVTVEGGENRSSFISAASFAKPGGPAQLGPGGTIVIETERFELRDGGQVTASTTGTGDAGSIVIDATSVAISGAADSSGFNVSGVFSQTLTDGVIDGGDSGDIAITAVEDVTVSNGGRITTDSSGTGDAGSINIDARNVVISGAAVPSGFNPSGVFSQPKTDGVEGLVGGGGDIVITTVEDVVVSNGGRISTDTSGAVPGGLIDITVGESVRLEGGASISADASGTGDSAGDAGDIDIVAGETVEMYDSSITTEATSSSGGNIKIAANDLVYLESSQIETEVIAGSRDEAAGDVTVGSEILALNHSHIIANAIGGADAGNITIVVEQFLPSGDSSLQASADIGIDGTINVSSPETDLTGTLATLPENFLDASALLARDCAARTARAGSFAVRTRGETPPPPDAMFELDDVGAGITPTDGVEGCPAVEERS